MRSYKVNSQWDIWAIFTHMLKVICSVTGQNTMGNRISGDLGRIGKRWWAPGLPGNPEKSVSFSGMDPMLAQFSFYFPLQPLHPLLFFFVYSPIHSFIHSHSLFLIYNIFHFPLTCRLHCFLFAINSRIWKFFFICNNTWNCILFTVFQYKYIHIHTRYFQFFTSINSSSHIYIFLMICKKKKKNKKTGKIIKNIQVWRIYNIYNYIIFQCK